MSRKAAIAPAGVALIFLGVMVALALIGASTGLLMTRGFDWTHKPQPVTPAQVAGQTPPEPRLQVDPLADRAVAVGPERKAAGYGQGRIPVDLAMKRLAARGWPDAEAAP